MIAKLSLLRPLNLLILALAHLALFLKYPIIGHTLNPILTLFLFSASTLFTTASGYVINDILDLESDRINHPSRPLVKESVSIKQAYTLYILLVIVSISTAALSQVPYWITYVLSFQFILFLYARILKRVPLMGNVLISFCVAAVFATTILVIDVNKIKILELATLAFSATFLRELYKTVQDTEGDKLAGFKTLSIKIGPELLLKVCTMLAMFFGLGWTLHFFFNFIRTSYNHMPATLSAAAALLFFVISFFPIHENFEHTAQKAAYYLKLFMAAMVLSLFILM